MIPLWADGFSTFWSWVRLPDFVPRGGQSMAGQPHQLTMFPSRNLGQVQSAQLLSLPLARRGTGPPAQILFRRVANITPGRPVKHGGTKADAQQHEVSLVVDATKHPTTSRIKIATPKVRARATFYIVYICMCIHDHSFYAFGLSLLFRTSLR